MKKNTAVGIMMGIAGLLVIAYTYYNYTLPPLEENEDQGSTVAATIFPLYDIARNVAGNSLEVKLLLPPGGSPHTFEPTPQTLKNLQDATALYVIGHGADDWVLDLVSGTDTEKIAVDKNIELREYETAHSHESESEEYENPETGHEHEHEEVDPHYWLTIPNAKIIARNIAEDLQQRYPEKENAIEQNLDSYLNELDAADQTVREKINTAENRKMVTMHDAWYYFAEEYGLEIAATFEPTPGREPTPQHLATLGRELKESGVRVIYAEPQISTDTLTPFTEDHNLSIATLDPIGGTENRKSYISTMIYNAETVAKNQ